MTSTIARPQPALVIKAARIIDLTHTFDSTSIYWPTERPFIHRFEHYGKTSDGYFYSSASFATPEHCGTHMDAPVHFSQHGMTADQVPLASTIGPAAVIDFSERASADPDTMLTIRDVREWESRHGDIPDGGIVVARSGWGRFWPDRKRYLGTEQLGDTARLRFPGISEVAAKFLLDLRRVAAIAIDTASLDPGNSTDFPVHRLWLGAGKPAFENLANADQLPEAGATIFCIPMKIGRGTGAASRIFALLD